MGEIRVYEYVYECGKNSGEYALLTCSYTYSYTRIPFFRVIKGAEKGDRHRAVALSDVCCVSCGTEPVPFFSERSYSHCVNC
jgi:hypothetical protein